MSSTSKGTPCQESQTLTKQKKKYQQISLDIREKLIKLVINRKTTIKQASVELGIKFSTSKAILQVFKREGRIGKKKTR
jgi:hypothetical protein